MGLFHLEIYEIWLAHQECQSQSEIRILLQAATIRVLSRNVRRRP